MHIARGKRYFMVYHRDPYSGSIPLLFNIHSYDLLYFLEDLDIASYADDTAIYTVSEKKESVIRALETSSSLLFGWLEKKLKTLLKMSL